MCDRLRYTVSRGALFVARDPLAQPKLDAVAAIFSRLDPHTIACLIACRLVPYFVPVFPAFFFSTSPVKRTPFCL